MNPWRRTTRPMTLAHRGQSTTLPEQTMAAFRAAVSAQADAIEADVHLTRDGHLVMLHDETVDRTTDGHGSVVEMALAEIRELDAGNWFGPEFRGMRVPTLDELLDLADAHGVILCLEAKGSDRVETAAVAFAIAHRLATRQLLGTHVLSSFDHEALRMAAARHPGLVLAPDRLPERGAMPDQAVVDQVRGMNAPIIQVHHAELSLGLVQALHDADVAIWAWPTTAAADIDRAHRLGVDGLMGDDVPELVKAAVRG